MCENKDANQLRGNREAGQRLCFRCTDSTVLLLQMFKPLSNFESPLSFVLLQFLVSYSPRTYNYYVKFE